MATINELLDRHEKALIDFERYRAEQMRPFNNDLASADDARMREREALSAQLQDEKEHLISYQYIELSKEAMSLEVAAILNERLQEQEMDKMFEYHEQNTWADQMAAEEPKQEEPTKDTAEPAKPSSQKQTPAERMKAILNKDKVQGQDQDQDQDR